jgi:hypothetical protein
MDEVNDKTNQGLAKNTAYQETRMAVSFASRDNTNNPIPASAHAQGRRCEICNQRSSKVLNITIYIRANAHPVKLIEI